MSTTTTPDLIAALRVLSAHGVVVQPPITQRIHLVSAVQLASLWDISERKAREIINSLPGSVRLGGGDLRGRLADLEKYLEEHPIK